MAESHRTHRLATVALLAWGAALSLGSPVVFCIPTGLALVLEHREARGHRGVSAADWLTRLRVLLTVVLGSSLLQAHPGLAVALGLLILTLDGLDGALARRTGNESTEGAWLDMEADALLVATASLSAFVYTSVGAWILIPGLARYVYVAVLWRWPARGPVPRSKWGRWSFAVGTIALVCLPSLPGSLRAAVAAAIVVNTLYSFGRSFAWSYRKVPAGGRLP